MFRAAECVVSRAVWLAPARSEQCPPTARPRSPFPPNLLPRNKTRALGTFVARRERRTPNPRRHGESKSFVNFFQTAATGENDQKLLVFRIERFDSWILGSNAPLAADSANRVSRQLDRNISAPRKETWEAMFASLRAARRGRHTPHARDATRERTNEDTARAGTFEDVGARSAGFLARPVRRRAVFRARAHGAFRVDRGGAAVSDEPAADPANRTPSARSTRPRPAVARAD